MRHWFLVLLLAGCPIRKIPDHLRPPEPVAGPENQRPESVDDLLSAWISADPLGRREPLIDLESVRALDGGEPYADLLAAGRSMASREAASIQQLEVLERAHRGTPIVALARGARLRGVQSLLADGGGGSQGRTLAMLTAQSEPQKTDTLPLGAMAWLAEPANLRDDGLAYGDRWVLAGWLDGPDIDLTPVAAAMQTTPFDHVRQSPLGRLLLARAAKRTQPAPQAFVDLERATLFALQTAAADSNRQQKALKATRDAMIEELGAHPNKVLLTRAADALTFNAADERSAGGALLAFAALRLHRACEDEPCIGLDRVHTLGAAAVWHPDVARLARLWQITAFKDALDGMDTARDTVRSHGATVELVDALNGTGKAPVEGGILMRRRPDSQTWLTIGRALGHEQLTTWEAVKPMLEAHLRELATEALSNEADPKVRSVLERL